MAQAILHSEGDIGGTRFHGWFGAGYTIGRWLSRIFFAAGRRLRHVWLTFDVGGRGRANRSQRITGPPILIRGIAAASTETVVAVEPSFRSFRCLVGLARVEADPLPGLVRLGRLVLGHWRELLDRPVVNRNGFGRAAALLDQFAGRGRPSAEADKRPHDLAPIGLVPMEPKMVG